MIWLARPRPLAYELQTWATLLYGLLLVGWATRGVCMTDDTISTLRQDTRNLFYHGFTNYLLHAFPEDELKPLSCRPQTRNRDNPADIGLNDVLGNYSLTLIDSLSTLAILASGNEDGKDGHHALQDFQQGVQALVGLYGNGTEGSCGSRACGFDLDSKVQVFETNIRGLGGLLSAHLFAIGELPIRGYDPRASVSLGLQPREDIINVKWDEGFTYDGQLLRLAHDLGNRLIPAFSTATDIPYPRVNLRYGIPFYQDAAEGVCRLDGTSTDPREITENCAAGAGSLLLEFTTLSRLTGDAVFEWLAKKAFWAVWERRSSIGLIGAGLDAENGQWTIPPLAGIGAGVDSFFEYALKSHIMFSSLPDEVFTFDWNTTISASDAFLNAWTGAHAAIKRHVRRSGASEKHPYYGQSDLVTGAPRYSWIDNLSAYYPGLLVLAGEVDEAIESHLLFAALWTRYAALPERWHTFTAGIDPNFKHWAGRPEFVESTYHLYQATRDPWYLHVGEMALRDIRRRCWTNCGWADLGDVMSGEQRDRMESFFLGETAKYLFLLFDEKHPLHAGNDVEQGVVFTTEGHPLVIPKWARRGNLTHPAQDEVHRASRRRIQQNEGKQDPVPPQPTCPAPDPPLPFSISNVANRSDLFHAAALAQLHLVPVNPARSSPLLGSSPANPSLGISMADVRSPTNYTFYPWTLPSNLIPKDGMSAALKAPIISTLTFPNFMPGAGDGKDGKPEDQTSNQGFIPLGALQKVVEGVLINSLSNVRLNMVQEPRSLPLDGADGGAVLEMGTEFRVQGIANWALGRDEKVLVSGQALEGVSPADPHFTRVKDLEWVDLVVDVPVSGSQSKLDDLDYIDVDEDDIIFDEFDLDFAANGTIADNLWQDLEAMFAHVLSGNADSTPTDLGHDEEGSAPTITSTVTLSTTEITAHPTLSRTFIPAILPTGVGAAPLQASMDTMDNLLTTPFGSLPFNKIFFLDDTLCTHTLPAEIAKQYSILVIKRGGCSFGDKLAHIPTFVPSDESLGLVVVLSMIEDGTTEAASHDHGGKKAGSDRQHHLIRPLLDLPQRTPNGLERRHPIAMCMVDAVRDSVVDTFKLAAAARGSFDKAGKLVEVRNPFISNPRSNDKGTESTTGAPGLGVKRRYWFESMGVPIGNLIML